ncbi:MAG: DUF1559 domain-containing protein [Pirellulales bacterium]|nr:DUF1559 domain-containing protein [Pirellulales bacterium]
MNISQRLGVRTTTVRFSRQPRGFTLVELLVVMATIGVLIALLLPAVSSVLESARRMTCASHLHQIGLALNGYSSHRQTFPAGCSDCAWWDADRKQHSWVTAILSRLDRPELQSRYDFDHAYHSDENREVGGEILPFLLCPSTKTTKRIGFTTGDKNTDQQWDFGDDLAYTDYGGIYGIEGPPYQAPWGSEHFVADHAIGVMVHEIPTAVRFISDGLSQTAIVGECTGRGGGVSEQSEWSNGQNVFAKYYQTPINKSQNNELWSDHPGGVQLLFCDGHVLFVSEEVDQEIVNAALTRAGSDRASFD